MGKQNEIKKCIMALASLVLAFVMVLCIVPTTVQAKEKVSTKKVVTIYGSNGKKYKSGSTIPLSALKGSSMKISGVSKKQSYFCTFITSPAKYKVAEDDMPDWGYSILVYNNKNQKNKLNKNIDMMELHKLGSKFSCKDLKYAYETAKSDKSYSYISFEMQPLSKKLETAKDVDLIYDLFTDTTYENYFRIDTKK